MRITADTTLGQLGVALGMAGVEYAMVRTQLGRERRLMVILGRVGLECAGTGITLDVAFDDALARFTHRAAQRDLGDRITQGDNE